MCTIERWLKDSDNLLTNQDFEGAFRNEKTCAHSLCILNSCLYVLLGQVFERVNLGNGVLEDLVENVIDASTTLCLSCNITDEGALK